MKALAIAKKTLLEYLREPLLIGLLFSCPILFLLFFFFAFGETDQGLASYLSLMVLNEDEGPVGGELVQALQTAEFDGLPIFEVQTVTVQSMAEISLRERKAAMLVVIPPELSQSVLAAAQGSPLDRPAEISLVGDPHSDTFAFARSMLEGIISEFIDGSLNWQIDLLEVSYEFLPGAGTMSDFEFGVPGMIVFGIMFMTISTTMTLVRENVNGTLKRMKLSRVTSFELLAGVTLAQMALALVQGPLIYGSAILMGFHNNGSLLLALFVTLLLNLSAVGLGLLTSCFAKSDGEAANLSSIVAVLMVLISGAAYPVPDAPIAKIAGRTIEIYDLLPPTHGAQALQQIMFYGKGVQAIGYELAALVILAVIFMLSGILFYQKLQLNKA
ncbi:MAG: ABC transporter permease [Anaerolineales bacterium]|nr:ABC transporter permease [Anaerolineales bacterium]